MRQLLGMWHCIRIRFWLSRFCTFDPVATLLGHRITVIAWGNGTGSAANPGALQSFLGYGGSGARVKDRLGAIYRQSPGTFDVGQALPH